MKELIGPPGPINEREIPLEVLKTELLRLAELREDEGLEEDERKAIDGEIKRYVEANLRKVDNVRQFWRVCEDNLASAEQDYKDASARRSQWNNRLEFIKGLCLDVMSTFKDGRGEPLKRLDGNHGFIRLQNNGGPVALEIYSPSLIPENMVLYRGWMSAEAMAAIPPEITARQDFQFEREPRLGTIKAELETKCPVCGGSGTWDGLPAGISEYKPQGCMGCSGTGHKLVPGARLGVRGQHARIR